MGEEFDERARREKKRTVRRDAASAESHREAERELRETRERYQALMQTISDFFWETDCQGRYTFCSPGVAKAREFKPDVVLCDIGLPDVDGYQVARAFRADGALKDTVLVALTGYALPDDIQRAAEAGFEHHFAKPPNMEELNALLGGLSCPVRSPLGRGLG